MDMLQKSRKLRFYAAGLAQLLAPDRLFQSRLERVLATLAEYDTDAILARVRYYNKLSSGFTVAGDGKRVKDFQYEKSGAYYLDMQSVARYFAPELRFAYRFGDVIQVPETPRIVKSRPIGEDNANAVLLKLNRVRHFNFIQDRLAFADKRDTVVWRGKCFREPRKRIVASLCDHPRLDVGQSDRKKRHQRDYRPFMSVREQLRYKFVLSLEGKDVATNLKWIMASNSLCFMPKPRFETWFMEGRLKPSYHYVQLKDDCSDIEEKMDYYLAHPQEAREIIRNANRHVEQFKDPRRERLISVLVLQKYFESSGQL